ncbi:putative ankyrin repeat-containing domain-containing protein [Helianthus annuus]|uniref:Ankyrin repeat-containing domain-containing protein n=1 Tax=Helianthus annuus TaxID=4232 RepID=A0A9K3N772_HELAN|nr:putative ankyrin repeat-containing domain-containing protein [Helianthus annuus]KAJ0541085.1 putative ankyrin repeat-containing domain-containing protein [Helianthus annuus]KAJ0706171.1 putative ankyrin repeat-containing domain-containing protein [Helianthus annuus]KAJ0886639.1 putative ankyrin repeat-containing domain-containing protein [Helianthus annuus]KAJ0891657.1 putative ankyrin repeat-containing domain-containing protein [Helianthus annuus]
MLEKVYTRVPIETNTKSESKQNLEKKIENLKYEGYLLRKDLLMGQGSRAKSIFERNEGLLGFVMVNDGSTILHFAVEAGQNDFVKKLFSCLTGEQLLHRRKSDGSTALHVAAIVGNKDAAELLVKKNKEFLRIKDHKGKEPLHKAYEHMHLDIIGYLLNAVNDDANAKFQSSPTGSVHPDDEIGVGVLVNAISAKRYCK